MVNTNTTTTTKRTTIIFAFKIPNPILLIGSKVELHVLLFSILYYFFEVGV
jgi:hypothetical protein